LSSFIDSADGPKATGKPIIARPRYYIVAVLRVLAAAAVALILGVAAGIGGERAQAGWDADQIARDHTIAAAPSKAEAIVTAVELDEDEHRNPNSIHYTFAVDGTSYTGADYSGEGGNPTYDRLRPGDVIHVSYYRLNPRVSCACDPLADLDNLRNIETSFGTVAGAVAGLMTALVIGLGLYLRHRIRRARSPI
jgi:hypothetical protein